MAYPNIIVVFRSLSMRSNKMHPKSNTFGEHHQRVLTEPDISFCGSVTLGVLLMCP